MAKETIKEATVKMLCWLVLVPVLFSKALFVAGLGGEFATLEVAPFTRGVVFRQNFCERYIRVAESNGTIKIKDALNGAQLRPVLQYGAGFPYFRYNSTHGIDRDNPGLVANMLDWIGAEERANFTWRDSFGVYSAEDKGPDKTWTEMLQWATNTYDLSVDKWAQSTERLRLGIAFCDSWFDASMIMLEKIEIEEPPISYTNWLRPFQGAVWLVTLATIFFSAFIYQFLEHMAGERDDRSFRKWFMDNLYLSAINFTQNYPYEPVSLAAKIFGFSFAFWTMLIGATYTANLASLLVEAQGTHQEVQTIQEAGRRQLKTCTYGKAAADLYLKANHPDVFRIERPSVESAYEGLNNGECDLIVDTQQTWDSFQFIREYNPTCQLKHVGRTVKYTDAGFATKVDPGFRCTGLVNEVINYWLSEMNDAGFLEQQWDEYNAASATENFSCNGADTSRRRLGQVQNDMTAVIDARQLKGGSSGGAAGGGAAATAASSDDGGGGGESSLTLDQMAGVFLLHLVGTIVAVVVAFCSRVEKEVNTKRHGSKEFSAKKATSEISTDEQSVQAQLESLQASQRELSIQMTMVLSKLNTISESMADDDKSFHSAKTETPKETSLFSPLAKIISSNNTVS